MLAIGFLCGLADARAQNADNAKVGGDLNWPSVPEISGPPPEEGVARARPSPSLNGWPGTDLPQVRRAPAQENNRPAERAQTAPESGSESPAQRAPRAQPSAPEPVAGVVVPPVPARLTETGETARDAAPVPYSPPEVANRPEPAPSPAETAPIAPEAVPTATKAVAAEEGAPAEAEAAPAAAEVAHAAPEPAPAEAAEATHAAPETVPAKPVEVTHASPEPAIATEVAHASPEPAPATAEVTHASPKTTPAATHEAELRKIIGQMIILGFDGRRVDEDGPKQVIAQIRSGKIGGAIFAGRNIHAPAQVKALTEAFQTAQDEPTPFLIVSQEGGTGNGLSADKGFSTYPSAGELGTSNDPLIAFSVYQNMADELSALGFNVNLGPVLDLAAEDNAGSGESRSYGASPKHVTAFANAFRTAHHYKGILTVLKHFPGRIGGATNAGAPTGADAVWDASALEPYRDFTAGDEPGIVMAGPFSHPAFSDEPGLPAFLSAKIIQTLLRGDIGFQGVVMSSDLEAAGLGERFPLKERVLRAIEAGNDLLLAGAAQDPAMADKIFEIVKTALGDGELTRKRLEASHERIVSLKRKLSSSQKSLASAGQRNE